MNKNELNEVIISLKKKLARGRNTLEQNVPWIEKNLKSYAQKVGIKPRDIDRFKDKVREKLKEIQNQK